VVAEAFADVGGDYQVVLEDYVADLVDRAAVQVDFLDGLWMDGLYLYPPLLTPYSYPRTISYAKDYGVKLNLLNLTQ